MNVAQTGLQREARALYRDFIQTGDAPEFIDGIDRLVAQGYDIDADPRNYTRLIDKRDAALYELNAKRAGYSKEGLQRMLWDMFGYGSLPEVAKIDEVRIHCAVSDAYLAKKFTQNRHAKSWCDQVNPDTWPSPGNYGVSWRERVYQGIIE